MDILVIPLAVQAPQNQAGEGFVYLIFALIAVIVVVLIAVAILRWALRIDEMVRYQRQSAGDLAALRKHFDEQEEAAKG